MLMEHLEKVIRKKLRKIGHIVNNSTANFYPRPHPNFFYLVGQKKLYLANIKKPVKIDVREKTIS